MAIVMHEEKLKDGFAKLNLPDYMLGGIQRYVMQGVPPGNFLTAVLENNLKESVNRADAQNQEALVNWVIFLWNYVPAGCWGKPERVEQWIKDGGLAGL
jgi:hypothetical protein